MKPLAVMDAQVIEILYYILFVALAHAYKHPYSLGVFSIVLCNHNKLLFMLQ
jgi:hypothetical protein